MKIERFDTFVLKVPTGTNTFYSSQAAFPERSALLVKVTTDEGLVGWGEGGQHGVLTMPHVWGSGVAVAAALQAIATIPPMPHTASPVTLQNEPMVEFDRTFNPLRDEILHENFAIDDGAVAIPSGPGLGISVDEKALERFVVRRGETATAS